MSEKRLPLHETLASLPSVWPEESTIAVQEMLQRQNLKVVVLDDDPTGTQTVHGVPVLTEWSVASLERELQNDLPSLYLLTNTRSLLLPEAQRINQEIGENLRQASARTQRPFVAVSRSDSTLRGHFPGELDSLSHALAEDFDAWLLIPFFLEGGRYTIADVHYVAEGEWLVPAGETAYASDATFGYRSSNLRDWVAEKTGGRIQARDVASVSIGEIRQGGSVAVAQKLNELPKGSVCVVNAAAVQDLYIFVKGLLTVEQQGKRFLYRTAASFVPVRAGIPPRPLLTAVDLPLTQQTGGLFLVGSYVPKTSAQVSRLLAEPDVHAVEVNARNLLQSTTRVSEIERAIATIDTQLQQGRDVVVFTSRELIVGKDAAESRAIGQKISSGLITIVQQLTVRPRYLLAKGGITSSDVATEGLGVQRALVRGQILPGVPLWELGDESRFPGLTYIVFPGNVGSTDALVQIRKILGQPQDAEVNKPPQAHVSAAPDLKGL